MTVADVLLDFAKMLTGIGKLLSSERERRRNEFAGYIQKLSECLTALAGDLDRKSVPYKRCCELSTYLREGADFLPDDVKYRKHIDTLERVAQVGVV